MSSDRHKQQRVTNDESRMSVAIRHVVETHMQQQYEADQILALDEDYSTTGNGLLVAVEREWFRQYRELQEEIAALPAPVDPDPIAASRGWGVYQLLDRLGETFYVGMTGTPKRRLAKHRSEFGELISSVSWTPTETRSEALILETEMIRRLDPRMNIAKAPS